MDERVTFKAGTFLYEAWLSGLQDFSCWLADEQRKCRPTGPCGQDVLTTSGARGLLGKYPTFESAYSAWASEKRREVARE